MPDGNDAVSSHYIKQIKSDEMGEPFKFFSKKNPPMRRGKCSLLFVTYQGQRGGETVEVVFAYAFIPFDIFFSETRVCTNVIRK